VSDAPQHPAILASDAEREATVDRLRRALVEGGGAFASQVIHSPEAPPVQGAPVLRKGDPSA
jgi:hypothetical protein